MSNTTEAKFKPKDLVEVWQDDDEKKMRGGPLFALVLRESNEEEDKEYELKEGNRAGTTFYLSLMEEAYHFISEQFIELAVRDGKIEEKYVQYLSDKAEADTQQATG